MSAFKNWLHEHQKQIREEFFHFLRFKSISADPASASEMKACAEWLKNYIGKHTTLKSELIPTETYPIVYAEDLHAGPNKPTLLLYGHYDVQPVDPLELWKSDPFEPIERDGKIFARGAVDDKGQIFFSLIAARAFKELKGRLPVNLKFCIEGEEESSSVGLSNALSKLKQKFKTDSLLVADFSQFDETTPALSLGARGILAMEVILTGSKSDLHSGEHGGLAYNPNKALAQLLAKLWDENGRVQIDGFYQDVVQTTPEERSHFAFRYDKKSYSREFGTQDPRFQDYGQQNYRSQYRVQPDGWRQPQQYNWRPPQQQQYGYRQPQEQFDYRDRRQEAIRRQQQQQQYYRPQQSSHGHDHNRTESFSYGSIPSGLTRDAGMAFAYAQQLASRDGVKIDVSSAGRSYQEQARLYNQLHGKSPVARPGTSNHEIGIAIDVRNYDRAKPYLLAAGFVHGDGRGRIKGDPYHFKFVG